MKDKKSRKEKIIEKLKSLEEIVKKFENNKVNIEEGLSEYEKAAKLIKSIKKELTGIEIKVEEIKNSYS